MVVISCCTSLQEPYASEYAQQNMQAFGLFSFFTVLINREGNLKLPFLLLNNKTGAVDRGGFKKHVQLPG